MTGSDGRARRGRKLTPDGHTRLNQAYIDRGLVRLGRAVRELGIDRAQLQRSIRDGRIPVTRFEWYGSEQVGISEETYQAIRRARELNARAQTPEAWKRLRELHESSG